MLINQIKTKWKNKDTLFSTTLKDPHLESENSSNFSIPRQLGRHCFSSTFKVSEKTFILKLQSKSKFKTCKREQEELHHQ